MATHAITSVATNLHGDVVNVKFLAVRGCYCKLHILVGRVILGLHPCAALTGADHQTLLAVITILYHPFHFCIGSSGIAIDKSIVVTGQCPCGGKGDSATQLYGIHRYVGYSSFVAQHSSHRTIEHTSGSSSHLGIEGLDECAALVADLQRFLPVLFVGRQQDALRGRDGNGACCRFETQSAECQFLGS